MNFCVNCRKLGTSKNVRNLVEALADSPLNTKWKYKLDDGVRDSLENDVYKPRHHPGILKLKTITIPQPFIKAVQITLEDENYPKNQLLENSGPFMRYLQKRKLPLEQDQLKETVGVLRQQVIERLEQKKPHLMNDKDVIKSQLTNELKKKVYNWAPVKYDFYNSLLYLVVRSAADYAAVVKILSEIAARDPEWKPKSLFDFGSGVGTVTWAANSIWPNNILEYFNVDTSREINELAEHILKGGRGEKQSPLRGVFYRQFLPAAPTPYDLVVSAYSLMEMPSLKTRLETIRTLWKKTSKYLVVVEQGTNAGYQIINEAREFVLSSGNGHVFGPCPHDDVCPRYVLNDGTPCNFEVRFNEMPLAGPPQMCKERYSYVVLKKGPRDENDPQWPRLVRDSLLRHKHCICNLCTSEGKLEQAIFTASKYDTPTYRCAKLSEWGDRLPMTLKEGCTDCNELETSETEFELREK